MTDLLIAAEAYIVVLKAEVSALKAERDALEAELNRRDEWTKKVAALIAQSSTLGGTQ